jgi:hypothetical protein
MTVRFTTYNLLDLFGAETAGARQHYETIAGVIRTLDADVLAVQEVLAPDAATAAGRIRMLADDVGMRCEVPGAAGPSSISGPSGSSGSSGAEAAVAFGGHGYHVGLMWREGIEPVPGSLRCYGGRDFWHGQDQARFLPRHPVQPGPEGGSERAPGGRGHQARRRGTRAGGRRLEYRVRGPDPGRPGLEAV